MLNAAFLKYWSLALPAGIALAVLYSFGYWNTFGVRVLSYISLHQLLLDSLGALTWVAACTVTGYTIGILLAKNAHYLRNFLVSRDLNWVLNLAEKIPLVIILLSTAASLYLAFIKSPLALMFAAPSLAFVCTWLGFKLDLLDSSSPQIATYIYIFTFAIAAGLITVSKGLKDAHDLIKGKDVYVEIVDSCAPRLIGKAGDYLFFFSPINDGVTFYSLSQKEEATTFYSVPNASCTQDDNRPEK